MADTDYCVFPTQVEVSMTTTHSVTSRVQLTTVCVSSPAPLALFALVADCQPAN